MNIERVMAYAFDLTDACNKNVIYSKWDKYIEAGFDPLEILFNFFIIRYGVAVETLEEFIKDKIYGKHIKTMFHLYQNTLKEIESQLQKCKIGEDHLQTIILF